jgi:hypothetical protein
MSSPQVSSNLSTSLFRPLLFSFPLFFALLLEVIELDESFPETFFFFKDEDAGLFFDVMLSPVAP